MDTNDITSIEEIKKSFDVNKGGIYCVSDWISIPVKGRQVSAKITAIHHDRIEVSNSKHVKLSLVNSESILNRLHSLLSSKENYSTTPALCAQYALLLIELDNAIVRFHLDRDIIKSMTISSNNVKASKLPFMKVNYKNWVDKFKELQQKWKYEDFDRTNDVCYFNPGFDYQQFIDNHASIWHALNDKITAFCDILMDINNHLSTNVGYQQAINNRGNELTHLVDNKLFISYSWSSSKEIDSICHALKNKGIQFHRDIVDCGYRQNIKNFEAEIGKGNYIIVYINPKYLHSIHCMYELALISESGNLCTRLFPVVSKNLNFDLACYSELVKYWQDEFDGRKQVLNALPSGVSLQALDELSYCDKISRELPKIWKYLQDHNHLTEDILMSDNCRQLMEEINTTLYKLKES